MDPFTDLAGFDGIDSYGLPAPPGGVSWEPPVELGGGVTPALLPLPPMCFELLAELGSGVSSVSAVTNRD